MKSEADIEKALERMDVHRQIAGRLGDVAYSVLAWALERPEGDRFQRLMDDTERLFEPAKLVIALMKGMEQGGADQQDKKETTDVTETETETSGETTVRGVSKRRRARHRSERL